MRILHLEPNRYPQLAKEKLNAIGTVDYQNCHSQLHLLQLVSLHAYDAVFVKLGLHFDVDFMKACPSLRWIITPTTGLNHIDLVEAQKRGIAVLSLKGETELLDRIKSTAEHTWGLLLMLARNLGGATEDIKGGHWRGEPFLATELDGKTLGILGLGRLGRIVAGYANAFGMKVQAYDPDPQAIHRCSQPVVAVSENVLFATSDILSLHIPSTIENAKYLDESRIAQMPEHALLINTARGEVVDEAALLNALKENRIKGAAIDVLDGDSAWAEMIPGRNAMIEYAREHNNLLITPHMGGYGKESIERTREFMVEKFLNGFEAS